MHIEASPFGWFTMLNVYVKISWTFLTELCGSWVERRGDFLVRSDVVGSNLLDVCNIKTRLCCRHGRNWWKFGACCHKKAVVMVGFSWRPMTAAFRLTGCERGKGMAENVGQWHRIEIRAAIWVKDKGSSVEKRQQRHGGEAGAVQKEETCLGGVAAQEDNPNCWLNDILGERPKYCCFKIWIRPNKFILT